MDFLLLLYANNLNKIQTITEKTEILKKIYRKNVNDESINNIYNKKIIEEKLAAIEKVDLPQEYHQVEYIKSNGTQYIDTGITPTALTRWELDMRVHTITWNVGLSSGCTGTYDQSMFCIGHSGNSSFYICMGKSDTTYINDVPFDQSRHMFVLDAKNLLKKIDNVSQSIPDNELLGMNTICLCARNRPDGIQNYNKIEIYSSKIYEDDVLIQHLVPCYRKSDHKPGLYDIVKDEFYINKGTGDKDFDVGIDID